MNYTPKTVLLYLGDPITLPHHSKVKSLMELAYSQTTHKQKQFIFDNKDAYPGIYILMEREHRVLKHKLHEQFFHFDDITNINFVRKLRFPKF
jgi:hypothetical protein